MATSYYGAQPIYRTGSQQGGSPNYYTQQYGGVPSLPLYTTDTQQTIGTDIMPQLVANLPGYQPMVAQSSANIQANLQGQLSQDVINQIRQQAAERGIATGAPGSANASASYLRALGLTSLQLKQLGENQLTAAVQRTPIQQTQLATQTTDLAAARAQYAAAPNPAAQAAASRAAAQSGIRAGLGAVAPVPAQPKPTTPWYEPRGNADYAWQAAWMASPQMQAAQQATFAATERARSFGGGEGWIPYEYSTPTYSEPLTPYASDLGLPDTYYSPDTQQSVYQPAYIDTLADTYYNPVTDQSTYMPSYWE